MSDYLRIHRLMADKYLQIFQQKNGFGNLAKKGFGNVANFAIMLRLSHLLLFLLLLLLLLLQGIEGQD